MKTTNLTRRQFVSASAGAATLVGSLASGVHGEEKSDPRRPGPNDRPRIAHIGCGGIGMMNAGVMVGHKRSDYVVFCDVDRPRVEQWAAKFSQRQGRKIDTCGDFREVLDRKDVDAVWISTPDHWHALITIYACMAGKDVFVEKPVSHNVLEGLAMVKAARKYDRVVQVGTQQRSSRHMTEACGYVREGNLGKVGLCKAWINAHKYNLTSPPDGDPPPGVDYDMWLGPAPKRPFNPNRFHYEWRRFWDYGGGVCCDWGVHLIDMIHLGMGVDAPLAVSSSGARDMLVDNCETPDTQIVLFEYPGFTATWEHRTGNRHPNNGMGHGVLYYGTKGTMVLSRERYHVASEQKAIANPPKAGADGRMYVNHSKNWLDCLASRQRPAADIAIAQRTTAAVQLANIALKVKRRIVWNPEKQEIVGDPEATALLGREYRKPWELPKV